MRVLSILFAGDLFLRCQPANGLLPQTSNLFRNGVLKSRGYSTGIAATIEQSNATLETSASPSPSPYDNFDYAAHWYPVIWVNDLRLKESTKVTVFDVDYVVAKLSDTEVVALEDKCPHKAAALSQGRVTESGKFQCAYHGWSFDGNSGECVEIPQIVRPDGSMPPTIPSKSCAKAVPAQVHQNMVWLFPGGGLEEALQAPPPPTVHEMEDLGFGMATAIRDMPVDWPIVVSNVYDADHGLFAHQSKAFDMYSASKDHPIELTEDFRDDGKGLVLQSKVEAVDKLLEVDRRVRGTTDKKKKNRKKTGDPPLTATSALHLPTHLQLKRVDKTANKTSFVTGFYVCPVGVGRTRFMAAAFSKRPPKKWLTKLVMDNFLDQDTYLLATQQQHILQEEAKDIREMTAKENLSVRDFASKKMKTRRDLFCLSSPTEKAGSKLEQFWDATLLRAPNRVSKLLQLDDAGAFLKTPPREAVLDRKSQHLDICPSAQDVVRNCDKVMSRSKAFVVALAAAKLVGRYWMKAQVLNVVLKPWVLLVAGGLATVASFFAKKLKAEYFFKYGDEFRRNDMTKIPKLVWADK